MTERTDPQLLKGMLPLLVLAVLRRSETYGYALVTRLQELGLDDLGTGTVYPVLGRLERDGLVSSRLVPSREGPARKYYLPTATGLAELDDTVAQWRRLGTTVEAALAPLDPLDPTGPKEES